MTDSVNHRFGALTYHHHHRRHMHGRVSRLRRSISRSIANGLSRSQLSLFDVPIPKHESILVNKFSTAATFPAFRQTVQANNEILREIISVFEERASLDFAYSKAMHKLSARLHKVSLGAVGAIDQSWTSVADWFDAHATIHSNMGSSLTDDIVQPLKSIFASQQHTIKAAEVLVDRELKKLNEARLNAAKLKRQLHTSSKELEKLEQAVDVERDASPRLSMRRKKLHDSVCRLESQYVEATVEGERRRRATDGALRKSVDRLEVIETQRLAHCQTALGRLQRKIAQLGPNLNQMFERHLSGLENAAIANPLDHIRSLAPSTAHPNSNLKHTLVLCDFHAENFGAVIGGGRRREALNRAAAIVDDHRIRLDNSKNGSAIENGDDGNRYLRSPSMANGSVYSNGTTITNGAVVDNVVDNQPISLVDFMGYISFKLDEAINSLDGLQNRRQHSLQRYQQKVIDKAGLPQTLLNIPLDESMQDLMDTTMPSCNATVRTASSDECDYEQIDNALPISPPHKQQQQHIQSNGFNRQQQNNRIGRVLYDFEPVEPEELAVRAGDCVIIEKTIGGDWLIGHVITANANADGEHCPQTRSGRFPANYVA